MNRSELIAAAAKRSGLSTDVVEQAMNALHSEITEALVSGQKVSITGFVTFETVERSAREGRNPSTGEKMHIPARTTVKISAGQSLKRAISEG